MISTYRSTIPQLSYICGIKIKTAEFVISNTDYKLCPQDQRPEFAFIGRSNVGKSSLINHFVINNEWYLVDLPAYGNAKASKGQREKWEKFIAEYLTKRE